jgi:hypothetical protein
MVLESLGEPDCFGDVIIRSDWSRALHFEVRGIPKFRFVVELNENRMRRGVRAKDGLSGEFLV